MSQTRTRSKTARPAKPASPKAGNGPAAGRKSLDEVEFSEEDAAFLRQIPGFYKEFPAAEVDEETGELYVIPELEEVMTLAMRFASTLNGAPARCRNQQCSKGRCHLRIEDNGDGVCHGGIGERTMDDAAKMIGFLIEVSKHYCPWAFR